MPKAITPLAEPSLHPASKAESHAKPIQSDGPIVQEKEAEKKAEGEDYRPVIYDGYPTKTGGADMDWDLDP